MAAKHVTVWRMKALPGKVGELREIMAARLDEPRLRAAGWQASVVGTSKDNPDEVWGTVTWDNTENYMKNANSPEQNKWYEQMRGLLAADPEWHDCDVLEDRRA